MSVNISADMVKAKRTASGPHIFHIDRIAKATGPKKLTASILTHPSGCIESTEEENEDSDVLKHMLLDPIIDRRSEAAKRNCNFQDLFPDKDQRESLLNQAAIVAIKTLTDHVEGYKHPKYTEDPKLNFQKKRPLPDKYRTRSTTVLSTLGEQVSAARIVSLIRDTYMTKLHIKEEDFIKRAIPCINDASINNLIRRTFMHPKTSSANQDLLATLQLGPGLNDILRKLVAQVIKVHCPKGLESRHGLAPLFKAVGKGHLALGKPADFESALSTMDTIVQSSFLDCWRINCGFPDVEAYAASSPSPDDLLALAKKIVIKHAKRIVPKQPDQFPDDRKYSDSAISDLEGTKREDQVYTNHRLMLRDTTYVVLLKRAICDADFGRVEDLLGVVGVYLLGAGMETVSTEILHFLFDLKHVWSETFGNIMRDSMIVSYFKKSGNAMPTDISLTNLALYSKFFYESYGWSDEWHVPKTMDEAIELVDKFDTKLAMKNITETMAREGDCCMM